MRARTPVLAAGAGVIAAAWWWRRHPSACPYGQRVWLEIPRPALTRRRLRAILEPRAGERILDLGVGTGYYALDAARWIEPQGGLLVLDMQQEMLQHTARRAAALGISNIEPRLGDATALPYADDELDGAYAITVLGEIPDQRAALAELHRVLAPGGRLIVGEIFGDPHMVRFGPLCKRAESVGFSFQRRLGGPLAYFARFTA
jgi:ubiquinone/menaquinone biosynthesis C-methylase UbiE